jgi:hypothetical protein
MPTTNKKKTTNFGSHERPTAFAAVLIAVLLMAGFYVPTIIDQPSIKRLLAH